MVQQFVELRLRSAGIKVPADNQPRLEDGGAVLSITVVSAEEGNLLEIVLKLSQMVRLVRKPSIGIWATTWEARESGGNDKSNEHNINLSRSVGS
jgi:hypothetical protein